LTGTKDTVTQPVVRLPHRRPWHGVDVPLRVREDAHAHPTRGSVRPLIWRPDSDHLVDHLWSGQTGYTEVRSGTGLYSKLEPTGRFELPASGLRNRCRRIVSSAHLACSVAWLGRCRIRKGGVDSVGSLTLHVRRDVGVQVKRDCYCRVAEHLRSHLRMHTVAKHECGRAMTQVMKSDGRETRPRERSPQRESQRGRRKEVAQFRREDQPAVAPLAANKQLLLRLAFAMFTEGADRDRPQSDSRAN
jgi:hypothetical protein